MVEEYAERANKINKKYLCISDHGMLAAVPRQIKACEEHNLSPIYASELYYNPMQPELQSSTDMSKFMKDLNDEEKSNMRVSAHLLAIACNETGYSNLVKLTSWGWCKGFYNKPRVNYEQLMAHKEGLIFTSCCYASEVGRAFDKHGPEMAMEVINRYVEMFGRDNYYLEFMLLDFSKQKPYNRFIVEAHEKTGLPVILTNDVHYCNQKDSHYQRLMLMVNRKRTIQEIEKILAENADADLFELQDSNLWYKSEEELNEKWLNDYSDIIPYEVFCEAKRNTVRICERAKGVQLDRSIKLPVLPDADEILKEKMLQGFKQRNLPRTREYLDRLKEEYGLICRKGFSSYFLIQKMICDEARRVAPRILGWGTGNEAVGPGRGCLAPSTPIVLSDGRTKAISEMKVGDRVVTRTGEICAVQRVWEYDCEEELFNIKCHYGDGISLTGDHKVLTARGESDLEWQRTDSLSVGDWVFIPDHQNMEDLCGPQFRRIDGGLLQRVREISIVKNPERKVYDLQVEKNHNYLTSSFLVHNSAVGSLVCYCLKITDVNPVYEGLLFSRFLSEARGGRSIVFDHKHVNPWPPGYE